MDKVQKARLGGLGVNLDCVSTVKVIICSIPPFIHANVKKASFQTLQFIIITIYHLTIYNL